MNVILGICEGTLTRVVYVLSVMVWRVLQLAVVCEEARLNRESV